MRERESHQFSHAQYFMTQAQKKHRKWLRGLSDELIRFRSPQDDYLIGDRLGRYSRLPIDATRSEQIGRRVLIAHLEIKHKRGAFTRISA